MSPSAPLPPPWLTPHLQPKASHLHPPPTSHADVNVTHLCRNGGLCMDAGNTHHCRCQAGYTGSYCEDQVDECSPSPCQNGATCTDYPGGYSCEVGTHPHGGEGVCAVRAKP